MKKLIFSALVLSLMMLAACGDDGNPPEVTITSPSEDATFMTTDTMRLIFSVTDDVDISAIVLNSPGFSTGVVPASELASEADLSFSGSFTIPCDVAADSYTISLTATDNDDNTSSAEVTVNIQ